MPRTYYIKFLIAASLVFLGAAFINLIVDPYAIWHTPSIAGVNTAKYAGFHSRIPKYVEWANWSKPPQTILLGTSRTADGMRTDHPALLDGTTYNMALGGQPIHESLVLFKHALKHGKLRRVVIGLDFFAFNAYWATDAVDEKRLVPGTNFDLLFNTSTFSDSITTIRHSLPEIEIISSAHAGGTADSAIPMRLRFKEVEKIFVTYHRPPPFQRYAYTNPKTGSNSIMDFQEMLNLAYANHIELYMFISPSHAWHWEGLANLGLWENWQQWKQTLVNLNHQEAAKTGIAAYQLWDFSGYNSITSEAVPATNAEHNMKWYADSSHYNRACGDLILDRVLGYSDASRPIPDDFGNLINQQNIVAHLSSIRLARKNYAASHAPDIQEMANLSRQVWNH